MAWNITHTFPKVRRTSIEPLLSGSAQANQYGYVQRKILIVRWENTIGDIQTLIEAERGSGWEIEHEPDIRFSIGPELQLYDADVVFIKYTSS